MATKDKSVRHKAIEYFHKHPKAKPMEVAKMFGASATNIYNYRKDARQLGPFRKAVVTGADQYKEGPASALTETQNQPQNAEAENQPTNTNQILNARAQDYGQFIGIATLTQRILGVMGQGKNAGNLAADQAEALHMIVHKTARIQNGDPDLVDSWDDIAGYAKLVSDRLQGCVR